MREIPSNHPGAETFSPVQAGDRIQLLDALRGLALFGILLVNMQGFKSPLLTADLVEPHIPGMANQISLVAINVLAGGKFIAAFSFLFGLGLVMQRNRARSAGYPFTPFVVRRMAVMLLLGILHGTLLWAGDVLALYAVYGLIGTLAIRLSPRALFVSAAIIFLLLLTSLLGMVAIDQGQITGDARREASDAWVQVFQTGSPSQIVSARFTEWAYLWIDSLSFQVPHALAFFLLGMGCGKIDILSKLDSLRGPVKRFAGLGFLSGIAASLVFYSLYWEWIPYSIGGVLFAMGGYYIGTVILALVYLVTAACILHCGRFPKVTTYLAQVGRLSLSNYLLQSLIANVIFMSWGLRLYGRIPSQVGILSTIAIFAFQIILSHVWLRRFEIGPVEWLWRRLSYPARG